MVVNFYINFTKEHTAIHFKAIASPISMQLGCTKLMLHTWLTQLGELHIKQSSYCDKMISMQLLSSCPEENHKWLTWGFTIYKSASILHQPSNDKNPWQQSTGRRQESLASARNVSTDQQCKDKRRNLQWCWHKKNSQMAGVLKSYIELCFWQISGQPQSAQLKRAG